MKIKFVTLNGYAGEMERATEGSAAVDLVLPEHLAIPPGKTRIVGLGFKMEIPSGYAGLILSRSGLASKLGVTVANSPGLIDSDYRGEVKVALYNRSKESIRFPAKSRVAQMTFVKIPQFEMEQVVAVEASDRGEGGFGSTGV